MKMERGRESERKREGEREREEERTFWLGGGEFDSNGHAV